MNATNNESSAWKVHDDSAERSGMKSRESKIEKRGL